MKRTYFSHTIFLPVFGLVLLFASCEEEATGPSGQPAGDFTFEIDEENPMLVHFDDTVENALAYLWDFGDNATLVAEDPSHTYTTAGTYTVTLTVYGGEGTSPVEVSKSVTVEEALFDGGLIAHGEGAWSVTHASEGNTVAIQPNGFNVTGPGSGENVMVWQAVEVEAGKSYQFNANVSSPGGQGIWSQLYFGTSEPQEGVDYGDNKVYGVSSWGYDGSCIASPIDGSIFDLNCDGSADPADGVFTFTESQTIYIVFKTGSNTSPGHSVTWYNVAFEEI